MLWLFKERNFVVMPKIIVEYIDFYDYSINNFILDVSSKEEAMFLVEAALKSHDKKIPNFDYRFDDEDRVTKIYYYTIDEYIEILEVKRDDET